jgi:hypothetical protein
MFHKRSSVMNLIYSGQKLFSYIKALFTLAKFVGKNIVDIAMRLCHPYLSDHLG